MSSTSLALPVLNSLKEQRLSSKEVHQILSLETSLWSTLFKIPCLLLAAGDARWSQAWETKGEPNSLGKAGEGPPVLGREKALFLPSFPWV